MNHKEKNEVGDEANESAKAVPEKSGIKEVDSIKGENNMLKETNNVNPENAAVSNTMQKALELVSLITDNSVTQRMATLFGVRARIRDTNQIRIPLNLALGTASDPAYAMPVAKCLANTYAAYADTSSSIMKALMDRSWALFVVRDKLILNQVKKFAHRRSIPGVSGLTNDIETPNYTYGESHTVIIGDPSDEADPAVCTIPCEQSVPPTKGLEEVCVEALALGNEFDVLARKMLDGISINPGDLPAPRVPDMYLYRGFLFLAAIARWLDAHCDQGGFLAAVQQYWTRAVSQASARVSPKVKDAIIAQYTLVHIAEQRPDYNEGWKEENIVETIKNSDEELFETYTETEYGKFLGKHGLGIVARHGFGEGRLKYRSYVRLLETDIAKLHRMADELREGLPVNE